MQENYVLKVFQNHSGIFVIYTNITIKHNYLNYGRSSVHEAIFSCDNYAKEMFFRTEQIELWTDANILKA